MDKECSCYKPCKHEEQVVIQLSIPMSAYKVLQYREAENKESDDSYIRSMSIEEDIIDALNSEDFFFMDVYAYEEYLKCNGKTLCKGMQLHHHFLDKG